MVNMNPDQECKQRGDKKKNERSISRYPIWKIYKAMDG